MNSFKNRQLQLKTKTNNRTSGSLVKPPEDEVNSSKVLPLPAIAGGIRLLAYAPRLYHRLNYPQQ